MLDFILGLMTGGVVGFFLCAMLVIAKDNQEEYEDDDYDF